MTTGPVTEQPGESRPDEDVMRPSYSPADLVLAKQVCKLHASSCGTEFSYASTAELIAKFNAKQPAADGDSILVSELRSAWCHAVRALNCAENASMKDTRQAMVEIVAVLSQQLEYAISSQSQE